MGIVAGWQRQRDRMCPTNASIRGVDDVVSIVSCRVVSHRFSRMCVWIETGINRFLYVSTIVPIIKCSEDLSSYIHSPMYRCANDKHDYAG